MKLRSKAHGVRSVAVNPLGHLHNGTWKKIKCEVEKEL